jgi:tRNA dimethylallyltransferase
VFTGAEELLNPTRTTTSPEEWKHYTCEICTDEEGRKGVVVGGENEWLQHLHSRHHKARVKGLKKRQAFEEWKITQGIKENGVEGG